MKIINVSLVLVNLNDLYFNFSVIVLMATLIIVKPYANNVILSVFNANSNIIIVHNVIKIISDIYQLINAFVWTVTMIMMSQFVKLAMRIAKIVIKINV